MVAERQTDHVDAGVITVNSRVRRVLVAEQKTHSLLAVQVGSYAQIARKEKRAAQGLAVKAVARTMHLASKTVDNHKSNIMAKLDIHDRVELARFAFREGLAAV